jgi:CHAT domain-containing protein
MKPATANADLLEQIVSAPPPMRGVVLRSAGDPDSLTSSLAPEAERLAITDLAKALATGQALVEAADQSASLTSRARARRAYAQGLAYANRFEDALKVLRAASALADEAGSAVEGAQSRLTTLHALARLGRYADAIESGEASRAAFAGASEPFHAARADINLGVVRRMSGDPLRALDHFDRAKPALAGHTVLLAQLESNRAEALLDLGRFSQAEDAFRTALTEFEKAKLGRARGVVLGNLGDLASRQGRLREALEWFELARRALGDVDAPGDAARLEVEQAEMLAALGMHDEAVRAYRHAVPILQAHTLAWEEARGHLGLGRVLTHLGALDEARDSLAAASAAFERLGHSPGVGIVRVHQAHVASRQGEPRAAETLLDEAVTLLQDRPTDLIAARVQRAALWLDEGRESDAQREYSHLLLEESKVRIAPLRASLLHALGQAQARGGHNDAAIASLREAIECIEKTRGELPGDRFRASYQGLNASIYADCVAAILDRGAPSAVSEAFEIAERASARSLLDLLDQGPGKDKAPTTDDALSLLADLDLNRRELSAIHDRIYGDASRRVAPAQLDQWVASAAQREHALRDVERRLAATSRFAEAFAAPIGLQSLQTRLSPGMGIVQFVPEGDTISLFHISAQGSGVVRRIAPIDEVASRVQAFHFQIHRAIARGRLDQERTRRLTDDCQRELGTLRSVLLGSIEPFLAAHPRLAVIPHGALHSIPFHAVLGTTPDRVVTHVPSASILARLMDRASKRATGPALIVGVSDDLAPRAQQEALAVASVMPGATVLLGAHATLSAVSHAMRGASLVHFATHARFVESDPQSSGIRLGNGWLTARDILSIPLQGSTVVLGGCDTGKAEVNASNEVFGLVRPFITSGAADLALSLWPIHDELTEQFMKVLYTSMGGRGAGGASLGTALGVAESRLRGLSTHPAFWAPFVRTGVP